MRKAMFTIVMLASTAVIFIAQPASGRVYTDSDPYSDCSLRMTSPPPSYDYKVGTCVGRYRILDRKNDVLVVQNLLTGITVTISIAELEELFAREETPPQAGGDPIAWP
ncbi:hypothetical protein [Nonomuraea angiospora]